MRSGHVRMDYDYLRYAGGNGYNWTASGDVTAAYNFYFGHSGVTPINGPSGRSFGFSLRCLQE